MAGTFTNLNYHIIFSTKERRKTISPDIQPRLYEYMGGILRRERTVLDEIGGMPDHVHLLFRFRPDATLSDLMRVLKSRSSGWIHQTFPERRTFAWQEGYAAFSVSESQCPGVREYVRNQEEHHRKRDYKEELRKLLEAHGIAHDEDKFWL